jgi:hypothetical protein
MQCNVCLLSASQCAQSETAYGGTSTIGVVSAAESNAASVNAVAIAVAAARILRQVWQQHRQVVKHAVDLQAVAPEHVQQLGAAKNCPACAHAPDGEWSTGGSSATRLCAL